MAQPKKIINTTESSLSMEGFDGIYESSTIASDENAKLEMIGQLNNQLNTLSQRLTEMVSLGIDQKVEIAKMGSQLIDNQRQLVAAQQILIRLMEKSIDLTRHIGFIEERLPALLELPKVVSALKDRIAQIEGVEFK